MPTEDDGTPKRYAPDQGTVLDNADPAGLGRVRIGVPNVFDAPGTPWAFPVGHSGGGGEKRGAIDVPPIGADVIVWYIGGDTDRPIYAPGPYGLGQAPGPVGGYVRMNEDGSAGTPPVIAPEDAHKVKAYESEKWAVVIDDRDGVERFAIEHKKSTTRIVLGESGNNLEISAVGLLLIKCDGTLRIDAQTLVLKDRPVLASSRPI